MYAAEDNLAETEWKEFKSGEGTQVRVVSLMRWGDTGEGGCTDEVGGHR